MSRPAHDVATAVTILCWLIDQHAPDPGLIMLQEKRPSNDDRAAWLRRRDALWLAVDTSRREGHAMTTAGLVEQRRCQPSVLKVTAKHARAVAYPSYRLTDLGRCWCVSLLESVGEAADAVHDAMLLAAMERPDELHALTAEINAHGMLSVPYAEHLRSPLHDDIARDHVASTDLALSWVALRLLGAGVRPRPDDDPQARATLFAGILRGAT